MDARLNVDFKVDKTTGMVKQNAGLSIDTDPAALSRFSSIRQVSEVPEGLKVVQAGGRLTHHEIRAARPMTPTEFQSLLNQVTFK